MSDPIARLNEALEGRYRVTSVLGSGGMATVYLAEQHEPVRRKVALKVLAAAEASEAILARFAAERQALAVMDHPGIAKVFDAGVARDGRPYFVMEVVEGSRIGDYCDERRLGIPARVRIFLDVCRAVQHAHQKGVVHRDLKPSNVLVSTVDGGALPRVIDFGIAKAVEVEEFDGTELTRADEIIGTPAYMSPEQISGSSDVDTRSDIYSLGVLLYELLVGALPYGRDSYRGWAALAAHLHRDPPAPARRLDGLSDTQLTIATNRDMDVAELRRQLAGDLSWIVSRAMEKERDDRYETVNAMARDLERYLANEPVRARPATAAYRVRKFVGRNRIAVGFAATAVIGLAGFAGAMAVQAARIAQARDEAEARRGQAEGLIDFMLGDLREKLEPVGRLDLLDDVGREAVRYFAALSEDQFSEAELLSRSRAMYQIGSVRLNEGRFADAQVAFAESMRLARELTSRDPTNTDWLYGQSQSHFWVGYVAWLQRDLATAEVEFGEYMRIARELVARDGSNQDWQLELGYAHSNLGSVREARNDLMGALQAFRETLTIKQRLADLAPADADARLEVARGHNKVGVALYKLGDLPGAEAEYRKDLAITRGLVQADPTNAIWLEAQALSHLYVGDILHAQGRSREALESYRDSSRGFRGLVERDPQNAEWTSSLAIALRGVGREVGALDEGAAGSPALNESEERFEALVQRDPDRLRFRRGLAGTLVASGRRLLQTGRTREALMRAESAVDLLVAIREEDADDQQALAWLADGLLLEGDIHAASSVDDGARDAWARALAVTREAPGSVHPPDLKGIRAQLLLHLGERERALALIDSLAATGYRPPDFSGALDRYDVALRPSRPNDSP